MKIDLNSILVEIGYSDCGGLPKTTRPSRAPSKVWWGISRCAALCVALRLCVQALVSTLGAETGASVVRHRAQGTAALLDCTTQEGVGLVAAIASWFQH